MKLRHTNRSLRVLTLLFCSAILPFALGAQQNSTDPFIWLEDIDAKRSMDWVNARNAATVAELGTTPLYQALYDLSINILDSQ